MKKFLLHISAFNCSSTRHGGVKRSSQLDEYAIECGGTTVFPYFFNLRSISHKIVHDPASFFWVLCFCFISIFRYAASLKGALKLLSYTANLPPVKNIRNYNVVSLEVCSNMPILVGLYLQWLGIKLVLIPQNVEFLVPGGQSFAFRSISASIASEIALVLKAIELFPMSDFDRAVWLSTGYSGKATTLPYFPSSKDLVQINKIKENRNCPNSSAPYFLVIGTVYNPPTRKSMQILLQLLSSISFESKVIVAGYGTECFEAFNSNSIVIEGSCSEQRVSTLLSGAAVVILNQLQTTGFLTRLVDYNLFGLPVVMIGDYLQAQGLSQYGIFMVSFEEVVELLNCFSGLSIKSFLEGKSVDSTPTYSNQACFVAKKRFERPANPFITFTND